MLLDVYVDGICLYGAAYFEPYQQKALLAIRQAGLQRVRQAGEWVWHFPQTRRRNWELIWEGYREFEG